MGTRRSLPRNQVHIPRDKTEATCLRHETDDDPFAAAAPPQAAAGISCKTPGAPRQVHVLRDEAEKINMLNDLLKENRGERVLVFCNTKRNCDHVTRELRYESIAAMVPPSHARWRMRARALPLSPSPVFHLQQLRTQSCHVTCPQLP